MIKTDFSQPKQFRNGVNSFFALPTVLYGLNFGVLGSMTNALLSVNFFGDFGLFFGQVFVLFCLVTKGLNAALIAALVSSITAAIFSQNPLLISVLLLEMLCVHVAMRKGYFLFQSVMAYWLFLGLPLYIALQALTSFTSGEILFISGVTRAINGLICVSVVAMFCWFIPSHYIYKKYYTKPPKLSSLIFSLCMLTVTLPAMLISLFFIWQSASHNELNLQQTLNNQSSQLTAANNIELKRHLNSISTISKILSSNSNARLQSLLDATEENYDLFESMIISDKDGRVLRAAPQEYRLLLSSLPSPSIQNREYFQKSKVSREPFINAPIIGKGFGANVIICFVSAIVSEDSFNGIVQGAVTLERLAAFNDLHITQGYYYIISDEKGRVVASSDDLGLPAMSNFDFQIYKEPLVQKTQAMKINNESFLYAQNKTINDWTITVVVPPDVIISKLVHYFFILVIATIFVLTAFALIAKSLSQKITRPLVNIADNFPNSELHPQIIRESQVSSEMVKLTNKLIDSHEVMSNFQQQLSEQVHIKTKQLKQLNRELYSIAQKDSLTQLLNRSGFNRLAMASFRNCVRNHISMSLVLIDIDYFKRINDTYGHPFGDVCIVSVAKSIQKHFKRDTDIIGRYGGEEFIIMIAGGEVSEHISRVALIKDEIQNMIFNKNGESVSMTISAGIGSMSADFTKDFEDLIQIADSQLYRSKRTGRNKISFEDPNVESA